MLFDMSAEISFAIVVSAFSLCLYKGSDFFAICKRIQKRIGKYTRKFFQPYRGCRRRRATKGDVKKQKKEKQVYFLVSLLIISALADKIF